MIAHRLETAVTHCDKVLVMDQGKVADFDHPFKLLANQVEDTTITRGEDSIFAQMVLALSLNQQEKIFNKAKKKYLR